MLNSSKQQLRDYGIFMGFLIFMFVVLFLLTLFSRTQWNEGLKMQVQTVLDRELQNKYTVENIVPIKSELSTSAACYKVAKKDEESAYAVILRIATIYGPQAGVFLCDKNGVSFVGFALSDVDESNRIRKAAEKSQISFWRNELARIIVVEGDKK